MSQKTEKNPENANFSLTETEKNEIQSHLENALNSKEKFCVDFSLLWKWTAYSTKGNAKKMLIRNFKINEDYTCLIHNDKLSGENPLNENIKFSLKSAIIFAKISKNPKSMLVYDFMVLCQNNFTYKIENTSQNVENKRFELISLHKENGKFLISALELYEFLGFHKAVWSRWYITNIVENIFMLKNHDWVGVNIMLSGVEVQDFGITIDFAKKIAMQARTQKGEDARNYFLQCEKELFAIKENPKKVELNEEMMPVLFDVLKSNSETMKVIQKGLDMQNQRIELLENQILKIPLLEQENQKLEQAISEIPFLKQEIQLLKQNQPFIKKDVFVVFFILENAFYKLVCAKNPILDEKVAFFMEFEQEEEAQIFEKIIFEILKFQKTHIKENLFSLEKKHFVFLENTKQIF